MSLDQIGAGQAVYAQDEVSARARAARARRWVQLAKRSCLASETRQARGGPSVAPRC